MSQTTITTFFNSRKRPATDEVVSAKNKIAHIEPVDSSLKSGTKSPFPKHGDIFARNFKQTASVTSSKSDVTKQTASVTNNKSEVTNAAEVQLASNDSTSSPQNNVEAFAKKASASNIIKSVEPSKPFTVSAARKELSLGDIKKKLAGSARLAELRATADRISKGIKELKDTTDKKIVNETAKKNLKEFKSIDVDVPQSPIKQSTSKAELSPPKNEPDGGTVQQRLFITPRKVVVSPVKSPSKVPAYIRHAHLVTPLSSLPLPYHYRCLAELFRAMETVVALLYNRNEKITFSKLKPCVQEMLKKNFTEKHLAQFKYLVPDFYNFQVQKNKNFSNTAHKESFELVISPNFPSDIKIMNPTVVLERRRYFYDALLKLVKKHHAQFCSTLSPPIEIPDDKIVRWHPEFELEKVPDVETVKLPELPNKEKYASAQDVLAKARELFKCNTKMERAMENLARAKAAGSMEQKKVATGVTEAEEKTTAQTSQPSTSGIQVINPALRGLPAALLEKIKAKQAAKALEAMTRSSENDQKYLIYSRLPDLARTLRNIFVTERKNVLALNVVLSKLDSSYKSSVSAKHLQSDIKLLAKEVPELIELHERRNTTYLKLDKNADLKKITSKLEAIADKYKY